MPIVITSLGIEQGNMFSLVRLAGWIVLLLSSSSCVFLRKCIFPQPFSFDQGCMEKRYGIRNHHRLPAVFLLHSWKSFFGAEYSFYNYWFVFAQEGDTKQRFEGISLKSLISGVMSLLWLPGAARLSVDTDWGKKQLKPRTLWQEPDQCERSINKTHTSMLFSPTMTQIETQQMCDKCVCKRCSDLQSSHSTISDGVESLISLSLTHALTRLRARGGIVWPWEGQTLRLVGWRFLFLSRGNMLLFIMIKYF